MPLVPIYVTAENVILETVNEFLEVAERAQSQHADRKLDRFAIITNVSLDSDASTGGPAKGFTCFAAGGRARQSRGMQCFRPEPLPGAETAAWLGLVRRDGWI
ncbi:hypothetical protein MCOR06_010117 [Pyricularia oryzae]|nr:hypothetical protein MCOR06_010117 [Pyricularia oryzae]